jgi:protein-S-isoprenylcysteine O-methyltransferase Ste14
MKKRIGIQGALIVSAIIVTVFFSDYLFPNWRKEGIDEVLDVAGLGVVLLGFLLRIAARGYKVECSAEGKNLLKGGPYKLMRNPMYFGTLLIGLGITMVIFQWWVFLLFVVVYLLIYLPQVKSEERMLSERFGREYKDYCKSTPRYVPRISSLFRENVRECIFFKWPWIGREMCSMSIILALVVLTESWKDARLFGGQAFFKELLESVAIIITYAVIMIWLFHGKENPSSTK